MRGTSGADRSTRLTFRSSEPHHSSAGAFTSGQDLFEQASGKDLAWFFDQWVREPGFADLSIENVRMKWNGSAYETRFDLAQHGKARRLSVPITFFSSTGQIDRIVEIDDKKIANAPPLREFKLPPGKHKVGIHGNKPPYAYYYTVELGPNEKKRFSPRFADTAY